ncbi:MAG: DUF4445 domain-containing protein [Chloroflexi bacterium]|nr:DUF4445 domain-containing protein [Chloroflexota bacterium]
MDAARSEVTIRLAGFDTEIAAAPGTSLLAAVRSAGMDVDADCAGRGTCGLCAVRFLMGAPPAGGDDEAVLGADSIADGWRLACQSYVSMSCTVSLTPPATRGSMHILADGAEARPRDRGLHRRAGWGAAIDLGTTTVVCYLMDLSRARQAGVAAFANPQRRFGQDIISRIAYAHESPEQLARLQAMLVGAIDEALAGLCSERGIARRELQAVTVAGNPTMLHLLAGIDPWPLGVAPFEPAFHESFTVASADLGFTRITAAVEILPLVAGHLGADAVAGIAALGLTRRPGLSLFIDLGTNGEIALADAGDAVGCSVAAGPAFEGGQISCGMAALPGAIRRVDEEDGRLRLDVIGGGAARGLCGSGLTDITALLLSRGGISPSGKMAAPGSVPASAPRYVRNGLRCGDDGVRFVLSEDAEPVVALSAHDVREVQLAKAAVRTGIDVLLEERGALPDQVDDVYLAGAFGSSIRPDSLLALGMLPPQLRGCIRPAGNTAGVGAKLALTYEESIDEARRLARTMRHIELMSRPDFQDRFAANIAFPAPAAPR